jgi:hypothetical protein
MGVNKRKILSEREGSGMTSVWDEYLCVTQNGDGSATLEVCMYEALGAIPSDEDSDDLVIPEEIGGKKVVGVSDEFFVGGELDCYDGRVLTYSAPDIERAIDWIASKYFEVTDQLIQDLHQSVKQT